MADMNDHHIISVNSIEHAIGAWHDPQGVDPFAVGRMSLAGVLGDPMRGQPDNVPSGLRTAVIEVLEDRLASAKAAGV